LNSSYIIAKNIKITPKEAIVRTYCSFKIELRLDIPLPQDASLIFRIRGGRNNKNDWYYLQTENPGDKGYAFLILKENVKILPLVVTGKDLFVKFKILEEKGISKGKTIEFHLHDTLVQSLAEEQKRIEIFIENPDHFVFYVQNSPFINIVNTNYDHLRLICPSTLKKDDSCQVLIRIEDKYHNLVKDFEGEIFLYLETPSEAHSKTKKIIITAQDEGLKRLTVFELNKIGLYRIKGIYQGKEFNSNPILCLNHPNDQKLFWGYIHGHTTKSDGIRDIHEYFNNLIEAGLDFGTSTEHDHLFETTKEDFQEIKEIVNSFNLRDDFTSLFGYEYGTWYTGYGDICIYHKTDDIPILRSEINKFNSTRKVEESLKPFKGKVLMCAHHTALRPGYRDWNFFNNDLEKLVEIYSTWGNQEYSFSRGNPIPPRYKFFGYGPYAKKRGPILEKKGCFVQDALQNGYKLGFTAGGDDHFGLFPSGPIDPDNGIYPPGIMAIWAEELTQESLWNALYNRRCYGTTGPRVIIKFSLDDYRMGDIIPVEDHSTSKKKRTIHMQVWSPLIIEKIQLIRNNEELAEFSPKSTFIDNSYVDEENLEDIFLEHIHKEELFCFYYLRIFLPEKNMAWSSPIWITQEK